jgi:hypothetical protein
MAALTTSEKTVVQVEQWFGAQFAELHPLLQNLHLHGGALSGMVDIQTGRGLGAFIGAALARKFSLPAAGDSHRFQVNIFHGTEGLHWHRHFDGHAEMKSLFVAVGALPDGCWIESTGPIRAALTVDVIDGGWYWRCLKIWVHGVRMPLWLLPRTTAFKRVEQGCYRFYVGFALPMLGTVLSYGGLLDAAIADEVQRNKKIK